MEAIMRIALVIGAAFAGLLCDVSASQAASDWYSRYPWCAVQSMGWGSVTRRCYFATFESCRNEVIAGNRGTCEPNSYYWAARWDAQHGLAGEPVKRKRRAR
jgi:hypothetical protein